MKWGIAIDAFYRCIIPKANKITADTLKLIDVLKCPICGYSDDGVDAVKLKGVVNHNERTNS